MIDVETVTTEEILMWATHINQRKKPIPYTAEDEMADNLADAVVRKYSCIKKYKPRLYTRYEKG